MICSCKSLEIFEGIVRIKMSHLNHRNRISQRIRLDSFYTSLPLVGKG